MVHFVYRKRKFVSREHFGVLLRFVPGGRPDEVAGQSARGRCWNQEHRGVSVHLAANIAGNTLTVIGALCGFLEIPLQ